MTCIQAAELSAHQNQRFNIMQIIFSRHSAALEFSSKMIALKIIWKLNSFLNLWVKKKESHWKLKS